MKMLAKFPLFVLAAVTLAGCADGLAPYNGNPNSVIATARDTGQDQVALLEGEAAVVYDPDGCQGWLMDDGVEGYSGRRFDPVSGLPVCNNLYPPGTVVNNYQTSAAPIRDYVPGVTN